MTYIGILVAISAVLFFLWLSDRKSDSVQSKLFSLESQMIDESIQSFGKLCFEIAKAAPVEDRKNITIRIVVDRNDVAVKLSIDVHSQNVNLKKLIPGQQYAQSLGWEGNERYLEGTVRRISLPDAWDGESVTECIKKDFRKGFPNAQFVNSFDDMTDTMTAGVIFSAII